MSETETKNANSGREKSPATKNQHQWVWLIVLLLAGVLIKWLPSFLPNYPRRYAGENKINFTPKPQVEKADQLPLAERAPAPITGIKKESVPFGDYWIELPEGWRMVESTPELLVAGPARNKGCAIGIQKLDAPNFAEAWKMIHQDILSSRIVQQGAIVEDGVLQTQWFDLYSLPIVLTKADGSVAEKPLPSLRHYRLIALVRCHNQIFSVTGTIDVEHSSPAVAGLPMKTIATVAKSITYRR